jgi:hypothetical protein
MAQFFSECMKSIMKRIFAIVLFAAFAACGDGGDDNDTNSTTEGHEQIQQPVENSGIEAERDRALDAIQQDTTGNTVTVGRDSARDDK